MYTEDFNDKLRRAKDKKSKTLNEMLQKYKKDMLGSSPTVYTLFNADGSIRQFESLDDALSAVYGDIQQEMQDSPCADMADDPWYVDPNENTVPDFLLENDNEYPLEELPEDLKIHNILDAIEFLEACEVEQSELLYLAQAAIQIYQYRESDVNS